MKKKSLVATTLLASLIIVAIGSEQNRNAVLSELTPLIEDSNIIFAKRPKLTESPTGLQKTITTAAADAALLMEKGTPDTLYKEVFARSPELRESLLLKSVIVKDSEFDLKKNALYSNRDYLEHSFQGLEQDHAKSFNLAVQLERIYKVDFIKIAASMKDNPQRDYIREQIEKTIQTMPEGYASASSENKRSMLGDRIELYYVMLKYFPDAMPEFNKNLKDMKLKKAIEYARRHVEELAQIDLEKM